MSTTTVCDHGHTASPGISSCLQTGAYIRPGEVVSNADPGGIAQPCAIGAPRVTARGGSSTY